MNQPKALLFQDTGQFPNSRLPVLVYSAALSQGEPADSELADSELADAFERRFAHHGWTGSWRNGLYRVHHYHSTAHEVLGVFRGSVNVRLGGPAGTVVKLSAGDVAVLPAGVAHKNEAQSGDFRVLGAYPTGTSWDMQYGKAGERPGTDKNIAKVPIPLADPLHGKAGPLRRLWS